MATKKTTKTPRPKAPRPEAAKPKAAKPKAAKPKAAKAAKPKAPRPKVKRPKAPRPAKASAAPRATKAPRAARRAAAAPEASSAPALFDGDLAVESRVDLAEDSGPVSPAYQFSMRLIVEARGGKLRLSHDEERGFQGGAFAVNIHEKKPITRADYEALWADLLRLGVFSAGADLIGDEGRRKIGVSFNYLIVKLGDREARIDYRLSDLARSKNAAQAAVVARVKALVQPEE